MLLQPHFLLVSYPVQGHINPALQLAKRLTTSYAAHVTFVTTATAHRRIIQNHPHLPFLTHAAILDGYDENGANSASDSPTKKMIRFSLAGSKSLLELARSLSDHGRPVTCIIYTLLLPWAADVAHQLGIPSALFWPQPAAAFSIFYHYWLDAKQLRTVVYVSFGSLLLLQKRQLEEITKGLMESGRPFLWVLRKAQREAEKDFVIGTEVIEDERGMVVEWCSQVEVLSHPSIGCFVTHCGWNSMAESLFSGVPTVGMPQWSDQPMNAKMAEDVWGSGFRGRVNGEGLVEAEELIRCLDAVMGEEGEGVRRRAEEWREKALEAVREGGSSHRSLGRFVEEFSGHVSQ
ncbi:UDP-glycosyltransferase 75B1 [Acorus gramineus]|uniref:UDP-glycosyltransferase 75B1 n=1 Tax=Acorus gramineus TaxID=55184 RepID=A0AAV9B238_ACOGR|nr:UDP-glycosyltransferase 75B1 [Acorus gramineus]